MDSKTEHVVDVATRIAAGDDKTRYDGVAKTLHWLTVAIVLFQFATAETWANFARPTRHLMIVGHMSFGILLGVVVAARIAWRLIPGQETPPQDVGLAGLAAKVVHYFLYVLLLFQFALGFVLRWAGAESMNFFGLQIPSPMAKVSRPVHEVMGDLHHWIGWTIVIVAAAHAAAALFHHFVMKDNVLRRMLPGARAA